MVKVGSNGVAVAYYDETNHQLKLTTSNAVKFDPSDVTNEGLTNQPGPEISTVTVTNSIRNNWAGKYITFNNGTTSSRLVQSQRERHGRGSQHHLHGVV